MSQSVSQAPTEVLAGAECIHPAPAVAAAYDRLALALAERLQGQYPLLLPVMIGGMIPAAALAERLAEPLQLDYVHATRYRGATTGGELHWQARPSCPLAGRTVVLVDDILDEGVTLAALQRWCQQEGAARVLTVVLCRKAHGRATRAGADLVGLEVPDRYVFGAGMDYEGCYRNLPGIWALPA